MNRYLNRVVDLYVLAFSFLIASRPISDADFWFHLKTGEYVVKSRLIPKTEIFSFTQFGQPWVAHGWLSGAIFYSLYSVLGFNFLIFFFALLSAIAFWLTFRRCQSHPLIAAVSTLLGVFAVLPNIGVRPRVFTLLLSSIYLLFLTRYARDRRRRIWVLVPLMLLWANLHGGFFIGLALIVLTMIGMVLDGWSSGEKILEVLPRLRMLGLTLLSCLLVVLVNPFGIRIYTFPLHVLSSPIFQDSVNDWLSPNFHQAELLPLVLLILATIAVLTLSPRRPRPSDLLFFLATLYATLKANRNMLVFSLVAVPVLAEQAQSFLESTSLGKLFGQSTVNAKRRGSLLMPVLLLVPLLVFIPKLRSEVYGPLRQDKNKIPIRAVESLREKGIAGNTVTYPSIWGGYLIWASPSNPVFIDGRDVYPDRFVKEYLDIVNGVADWRAAFDRYAVKIVVVRPNTFLARELQQSADWQLLHDDETAKLFTRR